VKVSPTTDQAVVEDLRPQAIEPCRMGAYARRRGPANQVRDRSQDRWYGHGLWRRGRALL